MVDFLDPATLEGNPFVSQGMKRRAREAALPVQSEVELTDPYKGNWLAETTRSTATNVANDWTTGMEVLGRGLVGDQAGAQRAAERYLARQEEARALGPRIQSFDDAKAAGGGVGDYAASLAYQSAALVPDMVSIATGIGAGEVAGRTAARGLVRRSIADAIERRAASTAARDEAVKVATRRAALSAPDGAAAVSAAMNTAEQQATRQARRAALQEAAKIAGRTPRVGANPFQETVSAAGKWAGRAAGTAAGVPRANNGNAEILADPETTQGDAAALLAGDVAGAATGLLPFERFVGQFGKRGAQEVARNADRFLPRVAKEFGKQGLAEGSQEVVQQATQLASHAYVKQNPELLYNDDAWNQYVASFGAGFFLGGAMGGAGEVGRGGARAARGAASRTLKSAQDMFREGVAKYGQRARDAFRSRAGEEVAPEDGAPSGEGVSGRFMRNLRSLGDSVGRMGKSAADKFRGNQDDVQNDDLADSLLGEFQRDGRWQIPDQQREPTQNPVEFKSPMQARLMSYVADDSPVWQDKNAARRVALSLERLFGDRAKANTVSDTDMGVYDWLVNSGSVSRRAMTAMKGIGHIYAGLDKQATALEDGAGDSAPNTAMADAMRSALEARRTAVADRDAAMADRGEDESARALEGEGDAVNATLSERSGPDAASPLRDQVANLRRSVIEANKRVQNARTEEARQHLIETERAPLDRQMKQAAAALREKILGPKGDPRGQDPLKYQYGRNVFDENKKAGNFDTKIREPGRVELVEQGKFVKRDGTSEPRRLGLSLDSLMLQELQENSADYQTLETSPERYKAAFMRVVGDVLQAGIRIKPESLTPGEIKNKDGQFLTRITPRDVAQLRGKIIRARREAKQIKPTARWTDLEGKARRERALGEGDFDEGPDTALGPRPLPEGRSVEGSFVPTSETVTDVKVAPSPYEGEVNGVRALRRTQGTTPRDVAQAIHEAGVRIGEAELAKQDAVGTISPSRLQRELDRLRDPQSGAARGYFKRAAEGAFDRGAPVEARARTERMEAIDRKEMSREEESFGVDPDATVADLGGSPDVPRNTGTARYDESTTTPAMRGKKPAPEVAARIAKQNPSKVKRRVVKKSDEQHDEIAENIHRNIHGDRDDMFAATHDSPHKFDGNFNWRGHKMKGEGAMAFGAGTYLSTSNGVHKSYKEKFTAQVSGVDPDDLASVQMHLKSETKKRDGLLDQATKVPGNNANKFVGRIWHYLPDEVFASVGFSDQVFATEKEAIAANRASFDKVQAETSKAGDRFDYVQGHWPLQELVDVTNMNIDALKDELDGMLQQGTHRSPTYQVSVRATPDEILDWDKPLSEQPELLAKLKNAPRTRNEHRPGKGWKWLPRKDGSWMSLVPVDLPGVDDVVETYEIKKEDGKYILYRVDEDGPDIDVGRYDNLQDAKDALVVTNTNPYYAIAVDTLRGDSIAPGALANSTGATIYKALSRSLGGDAKASDYLQSIGIVGHKYAAIGGSNAKFPNYVIYDDSRIVTNAVQFDEVVADGAKSASAPSGPHDLKAEAAMLNALAEAAGARTGIVVESAGAHDPKRGGSYSRGKLRIKINDNLHGAERMEVLLHELGHHLIWNEVAKLVGWDVVQGKNMSLATAMSALKAGNPELHTALMHDFNAWRESGASSKPYHRAQRGASISFEDDAVAFHEWMADNVARALSRQKKPVGIVAKFFGKIATQLRSAWRKLVASDGDKEYAAAKSVDAWVRSLFDANTAAVKQVTGQTLPGKAAGNVVEGAAVAAANAPAEAFTVANVPALVNFINTVLKPAERQILDNVFGRHVAYKHLREFWNDKLPDVVPMLDDAKESLENRIALGYLAWKAGAFNNVGPKGTSALVDLRDNALSIMGMAGEGDLATRVLEDIANGTIQHFHDRSKTYSVRELEARARGTRQRALNWLAKEGPVSNALTRFWTSQYKRMHDSGIPAMRALAATLQRPQGATGDEDRGMNVAVRVQMFKFQKQFAAAISGLDAGEQQRVLQTLQRQAAPGTPAYDKLSTKNKKAVDAIRAVFASAHAYGNDPAVRMWGDPNRPENLAHRPYYAPVIMDVRNPEAMDRLTKLYSKPQYKGAIFDRFSIPSDERTDATHARLVKRLVDAAAFSAADPMGGDGVIKGTRSQNFRVSQFIYDGGNAADIRELAALQTKNIDEMFARYFSPVVKAAEFRRRFGQMEAETDAEGNERQRFNPRGKLDEMLRTIKRQGGTDEDVKLAENAVKAALGTYGADGSPTLNAISPALAKKFSGPRTKAVIEGGQAYQNTRLLPLALLSSLVDPMGIAVRTGGDFSSAWDGFRAGMRSLTNKKDARELLSALEEIGSGDDFLPALAAHPVFDGQENSFARRVNDFVFKWNGMQTWIAATRIMAMEAGHRFLLKHAAADTDQSRRYLAELSLSPEDIAANPDKPGRVVLNDKTRVALNQFVDEAILRPNSLQVPLWHRDPYMGLLSQYKAFGYAIYDQISGRISREMTHGNYRVMLAALSYAPIVIMAELLRELIQYGAEGNPNRKEWGPGEYTALAADRSGLLGPKAGILGDLRGDMQRRNLPGASQLGPTLGQAGNAGDALSGRRDLGSEVESALPGSAAFRHWNDAAAVQDQPTGKART